MSKRTTIYLHIGLPKTGTTSFQEFCGQNKEYLSRHKILYYEPMYRKVNGHEVGEIYVREPVFTRNDIDERKKTVPKHLAEFMYQTGKEESSGLISAESISWFRTSKECINLKQAFGDNAHFVIILCLRDVDEWWVSYKKPDCKRGNEFRPRVV